MQRLYIIPEIHITLIISYIYRQKAHTQEFKQIKNNNKYNVIHREREEEKLTPDASFYLFRHTKVCKVFVPKSMLNLSNINARQGLN